jgi:hypothetical protein
MDPVAAADRRGVLVLQRAALDRGEQRVEVFEQQIAGLRQLHRQGGVKHVAAGHPLVHEPRLGTHLLRHPVEESDHIVLGHRLDRVDRGDVDLGIGCPPVPQRLGPARRHHAQLAQLLGGMRLDLEPDLEARLRLPDRGHRGAGVAGDHALYSLPVSASR